jgi:hypothetical protein
MEPIAATARQIAEADFSPQDTQCRTSIATSAGARHQNRLSVDHDFVAKPLGLRTSHFVASGLRFVRFAGACAAPCHSFLARLRHAGRIWITGDDAPRFRGWLWSRTGIWITVHASPFGHGLCTETRIWIARTHALRRPRDSPEQRVGGELHRVPYGQLFGFRPDLLDFRFSELVCAICFA